MFLFSVNFRYNETEMDTFELQTNDDRGIFDVMIDRHIDRWTQKGDMQS